MAAGMNSMHATSPQQIVSPFITTLEEQRYHLFYDNIISGRQTPITIFGHVCTETEMKAVKFVIASSRSKVTSF